MAGTIYSDPNPTQKGTDTVKIDRISTINSALSEVREALADVEDHVAEQHLKDAIKSLLEAAAATGSAVWSSFIVTLVTEPQFDAQEFAEGLRELIVNDWTETLDVKVTAQERQSEPFVLHDVEELKNEIVALRQAVRDLCRGLHNFRSEPEAWATSSASRGAVGRALNEG